MLAAAGFYWEALGGVEGAARACLIAAITLAAIASLFWAVWFFRKRAGDAKVPPLSQAAEHSPNSPILANVGSVRDININSPRTEERKLTDLEEWGSSYNPAQLKLVPESGFSNQATLRVENDSWKGLFGCTVDFSESGLTKVNGCWRDVSNHQLLEQGEVGRILIAESRVQQQGDDESLEVFFLEGGGDRRCFERRLGFIESRDVGIRASYAVKVTVTRIKPPSRDASDVHTLDCLLQLSNDGKVRLLARQQAPDTEVDQIPPRL